MHAPRFNKLFAVALLCATLCSARGFAQVPHFHKLFTDSGAVFWRSDYRQSMVVSSTSIFTLLDHGDGTLLVKTDLSGNLVWSHLFGDLRITASTLTLGVGDDLILAVQSGDWSTAIIAKVDAGTGNVVWSRRYPTLDDIATITQRGNRYVVMGTTSYAGLGKPLAISINDADGSVAWAKLYLEVDAAYTTSYNHFVHSAAVNPNVVVFAGMFYDGINIANARPRLTMLTIDASTGNASTGAMHSYDVNWLAVGDPLESDTPYVWNITSVKTDAGALSGFALGGTYPMGAGSGAPAIVRVDQSGALRWAKLYRSSNSSSGFGRGVRQNQFFNAGRLDLYTSWTFYRNAIDPTGTASGLMRINEVDGTVAGMTVYDAPDYYAGQTMHDDGAGGYLLLATLDRTPILSTSVELLKVGQIGGNVSCTAEDTTLTVTPLSVTDLSIALVSSDVTVTPVDTALTWVDRALTVTDCNCP